MAGRVSGRMTLQNVRQTPAPSTIAASFSSLRQGLHVVAQDERAEPELEGDVDHHDPEVLVVEERRCR